MFSTDEDAVVEAEIMTALQERWGCEVRHFGSLSPIDGYCAKAGRIKGLLEIKNRSHASTEYPTVFLALRKWISLQVALAGINASGMGGEVHAFFVVRFLDGIKWIDIANVDASRVRMGGRPPRPGSRNDIEPIIDVDVASMKFLNGANGGESGAA